MIKKLKFLIFPTLLFSLASCTVNKEIHRWNFYFDTYCDYKLFEGEVNNVIDIDDILSKIDKLKFIFPLDAESSVSHLRESY